MSQLVHSLMSTGSGNIQRRSKGGFDADERVTAAAAASYVAEVGDV